MTRRPSLARAVAQLDRHGSGTPNDVPPVPEPWTFAGFAESMRAAFTPGRTVSMNSSGNLSTAPPSITMEWDRR